MASTVAFLMEQGTTFSRTVQWLDQNETPIDITGYTIDMILRNVNTGDPYTVTDIDTVPLEGKITFTIPPADTTTLDEEYYAYELKVTSPTSVVTRLLQGQIRTSPSIF